MRYTLAFVAILLIAPASAESFRTQATRLCSSVEQSDCWVKGNTPICDREQIVCRRVTEDRPARIVKWDGNRVFVETEVSEGYISASRIVFDGSK